LISRTCDASSRSGTASIMTESSLVAVRAPGPARTGGRSVAQVCAENVLATGTEIGMMVAIVMRIVNLVGQVQRVQLQTQVLVDPVCRHGIEAPVARGIGALLAAAGCAVAGAAIHFAYIVGARAQ